MSNLLLKKSRPSLTLLESERLPLECARSFLGTHEGHTTRVFNLDLTQSPPGYCLEHSVPGPARSAPATWRTCLAVLSAPWMEPVLAQEGPVVLHPAAEA